MPVGSFPRGVALVFRGKNVVQVLIAISKVLAVTKKVVSPIAVRLVLSRSWPTVKIRPSGLCAYPSCSCVTPLIGWMDGWMGGTKGRTKGKRSAYRSSIIWVPSGLRPTREAASVGSTLARLNKSEVGEHLSS